MNRISAPQSDGRTDCAAALQSAIDDAARQGRTLYIPQGLYIVGQPLKLPSNAQIAAHPNARIKLEGDRPKHRGDCLLTNADHESGNRNISITGGVWDGNNAGPGNKKPEDIFDPDGYSGAVISFAGVENLTVRDVTIANSTTYNLRICRVSHFTLENISILSDVSVPNQDGIHFNGEVRHGVVRNVRALSKGQTNDDLIAFNADDSMLRCENYGMVRGAIEDILVEDVFAEDCHTILRFLSTAAPIRNITVRNVCAGYRCYAVNMDGARYCRTPLFQEEEFPSGCGQMENIRIENMTCWKTSNRQDPAVCLETRAENFVMEDFNELPPLDPGAESLALRARNLKDIRLTIDGEEHILNDKAECLQMKSMNNMKIEGTRP